MEKTGTVCVGVDDTATLTWIEYKLETFATIIKERLSKIVEAKETVSDWDKAAWFTSIVVLLGKVLPANRFLFRVIEEENQFLIQLHDPAQMQQPQEIEVPYRKVFDYGVKSWEEALMQSKEDRLALYTRWKEAGLSTKQIAGHFNTTRAAVLALSKHRSQSEVALLHKDSNAAIMKRVLMFLKEAGINSCHVTNVMQDAFECKTGRAISKPSIYMASKSKAVSTDTDMCLDISILYIEGVINYIKSINEMVYSDSSLAGTLANLRRSTGISLFGKQKWTGQGMVTLINHDGLEKCISLYTNVLTTLKQRKENGK